MISLNLSEVIYRNTQDFVGKQVCVSLCFFRRRGGMEFSLDIPVCFLTGIQLVINLVVSLEHCLGGCLSCVFSVNCKLDSARHSGDSFKVPRIIDR